MNNLRILRYTSVFHWTLLGALLASCTSNPHPYSSSMGLEAIEIAATEWYEVISHQPGEEVTDETMRRKIEQSGHPWKVRDRATGIEMVLVMPGKFLMGSPKSEEGRFKNEGPQHRVRLTKPYYLGVTELTQAQWKRVTGESLGYFKGENKPVDGSWDNLQNFLSNANADNQAGVELLRAPTEAEWEYACRAGTTGPYNFDGPVWHDVMNFNDGIVDSPYWDGKLKIVDGKMVVHWEVPPSPEYRMTTAPAGSLPPNAWGLHEMHGNLAEWCDGKYSPYAYENLGSVVVDPYVPANVDDQRILRGGSWYRSARFSRSAKRGPGGPHTAGNRMGFRVARTAHSADCVAEAATTRSATGSFD